MYARREAASSLASCCHLSSFSISPLLLIPSSVLFPSLNSSSSVSASFFHLSASALLIPVSSWSWREAKRADGEDAAATRTDCGGSG